MGERSRSEDSLEVYLLLNVDLFCRVTLHPFEPELILVA